MMALKNLLITSLLGGIAMFLWGFLSHAVLGIGSPGIKELPSEEVMLNMMRSTITQPGFYMFPGMGETSDMPAEIQEEAEQRWAEKMMKGPTGILVYNPEGNEPLSFGQLFTELFSNIFAALLAALLLTRAVGGLPTFGNRVIFIALLGLIASIAIDVSYWNWYGFPTSFTFSSLIDQTVGFGMAGLVLAWRISPMRV